MSPPQLFLLVTFLQPTPLQYLLLSLLDPDSKLCPCSTLQNLPPCLCSCPWSVQRSCCNKGYLDSQTRTHLVSVHTDHRWLSETSGPQGSHCAPAKQQKSSWQLNLWEVPSEKKNCANSKRLGNILLHHINTDMVRKDSICSANVTVSCVTNNILILWT